MTSYPSRKDPLITHTRRTFAKNTTAKTQSSIVPCALKNLYERKISGGTLAINNMHPVHTDPFCEQCLALLRNSRHQDRKSADPLRPLRRKINRATAEAYPSRRIIAAIAKKNVISCMTLSDGRTRPQSRYRIHSR